jgi:hypothetical protein
MARRHGGRGRARRGRHRDELRLSRNDLDWYQLVYLCRWSGTLIADRQGYDPLSSSDRMVLGIRGQVSGLERDSLVHHMAEARWNRARREMFTQPPAGHDLDELGQLMRTWSAEATLRPGRAPGHTRRMRRIHERHRGGDVLLVTSNRAIQKSSHDPVSRRSAPAPDATWQQTATTVNENGLIEAVLLRKAYRLEPTA